MIHTHYWNSQSVINEIKNPRWCKTIRFWWRINLNIEVSMEIFTMFLYTKFQTDRSKKKWNFQYMCLKMTPFTTEAYLSHPGKKRQKKQTKYTYSIYNHFVWYKANLLFIHKDIHNAWDWAYMVHALTC